ncbi:Hsp20/alpha crystallin family protein [Desulfofundulus sp.]|uniref:Hsp20/alpha crystallin family protein n=1 Tax=Desulfofundulus sp. TaxID=2282750 RepID=UPI003C7611E3
MTLLPKLWEEPFRLISNIGSLLDNIDSELGLWTGYGRTDIYEKDGKLYYEIELPGLKKEDLKARIEDNRLIVKGEIKKDVTIDDDNYLRMERRYGRFQKSFLLPEQVGEITDKDLEARFEDGVLKIALPLKESIRGKVIDIEIQ